MLSHFVLEYEHSQVKPAIPLVRNNPLEQEFILLPRCYKSDVDGYIGPDSRLSSLVWEGLGQGKDEVIDLVYTGALVGREGSLATGPERTWDIFWGLLIFS